MKRIRSQGAFFRSDESEQHKLFHFDIFSDCNAPQDIDLSLGTTSPSNAYTVAGLTAISLIIIYIEEGEVNISISGGGAINVRKMFVFLDCSATSFVLTNPSVSVGAKVRLVIG